MVIRVWDFILIGLIRDEKSSPPRLTYLALLRFTQIFFASKRCWAKDKFCSSRPVSPHISFNARVCVFIIIFKKHLFSHSLLVLLQLHFSIYFIFISSILIGLVKHLQPTPNPAYIMGQPMIQPRPTPLPSCWIVI